jgi:hypothetical protein
VDFRWPARSITSHNLSTARRGKVALRRPTAKKGRRATAPNSTIDLLSLKRRLTWKRLIRRHTGTLRAPRRWSRPDHEVDFSNWPVRSPPMSAVSEQADNHSIAVVLIVGQAKRPSQRTCVGDGPATPTKDVCIPVGRSRCRISESPSMMVERLAERSRAGKDTSRC